jgi:O-antigen ligase
LTAQARRSGWLEQAGYVLLAVFVFTIPWEKTLTIPGIGTFARLAGIIAFAAGVLAAAARRDLRKPNVALILALLFTLWTAVTFFWSQAPASTQARTLTFAQLLAMWWLVWEFARGGRRQARLLQAYVLGAVVASAATIARYLEGTETYYRRYAAPGFDPNDLGVTAALALPLCFYLALSATGGTRWLWRAAVAAIITAVLLTGSRTAMIAAYAGFAFPLLTWRKSDKTQRLSAALLLGFLLLGTFRLAPEHSRQRLATVGQELTQGTLHNRTRIWKAGLKALKGNPVFGAGAGAYPEAVRPWLGRPGLPGHEYVAHNTFLSVLVETGLIGFGLFAALLAALAVFVWIMPPAERALWTVMLAVWAIGVSTLTWEHRKATWIIFALITAQWARSFVSAEKR